MIALLWLRRDLRLHDNPALVAAARGADSLVPLFCFDPRLLHGRHESGARTQFLLECLQDVDRSLAQRGSRLVVRYGDPERAIVSLARRLGAGRVHLSGDAGPFARARDARVSDALRRAGIEAITHPGVFAVDDLQEIRTAGGSPYTVFTPFYRSWTRSPRRQVERAHRSLPALPAGVSPGTLPSLADLGLRQELEDPPAGGERHGRRRMQQFLARGLAGYASGRDQLDGEGSSRLSPYLHLGCISPRELECRLPCGEDAEAFARQLCWRDFYAQVLLQFPANSRSEHQRRYRGAIRWSHARRRFQAWCEGRTGYPLVDAGMRQLRREGWMHNRARLVVGSFLTKDLGIDWRWGERWFMRLLLDGDQSSNNGNWQWIASVGVDPQPPYRRIYNPARQQARFDPDGRYVRRHVAELRRVPDEFLAEPWTMPAAVQQQAGCVIGHDYPRPIVDHAHARRQALARYAAAR
jgi:deoxyribodipyrimidine photo-lyase